MAEPGTLKGRHYAQMFLILLLFMFAIFTRKTIWIYYVRTCVGGWWGCGLWVYGDGAPGRPLTSESTNHGAPTVRLTNPPP